MPKTPNPLTKKSAPSTNIVLTVVVAVVAVVVIGAVLLFNSGGNENAGGQSGESVPAEVLQKPDANTVMEAPDGKVTVVEFLDYQCPVCQKYYAEITKQVEQDYEGRITFITRNFPLDMHPLAMPAAKAAEAAALQGKYTEMYHGIYEDWQSWAVGQNGQETSGDEQRARRVFDGIAQRIGLDMNKFHQDMDSEQVQQRIDRDIADGEKAGVSSTPSMFINGQRWQPSDDVKTFDEAAQQFRQQLDEALAR
ncbi:DsbA family protein [Parasphingorhabdus pacifica]